MCLFSFAFRKWTIADVDIICRQILDCVWAPKWIQMIEKSTDDPFTAQIYALTLKSMLKQQWIVHCSINYSKKN